MNRKALRLVTTPPKIERKTETEPKRRNRPLERLEAISAGISLIQSLAEKLRRDIEAQEQP